MDSLFADESIHEIIVLYPNILEDNVFLTDSNPTLEIAPKMITPINNFVYRVTNVNNSSDWTGSTKIATANGNSGITLSLSQSKSISCTYSTSISVNAKTITAGVGFSVTGSETINISGSYKVPSTYNGKKVIKGYLEAYPIYNKKTFTIQSKPAIGGSWSNVGSGSASRPYGVSFKRYCSVYS